MIKNYFKIAFRNLWKRKGYSLINIAGLSVSIALAILITLFAVNELTYDHFHEHADQIYRVYKERVTPTGTQETYDTWVPLKIEMEKTYPSVKRAARIFTQNIWMQANGKRFQETVMYTDPELFEMFTLPLSRGNSDNPFPSLQSMVISRDIARKYFGDEDPIGKIFRLAYARDYVVSGVLEEIPQNSSIQIDMAVQMESAGGYENVKENWNSSFLATYIQLNKEASAADLEAQFPAFITKIWDKDTAERTNFKLLSLTDQYDRFNDSDKYAFILLGIAAAIILIACINFMNMATARSLERAREVGMRKVLGGQRVQLIMQFLGESVLVTLLALLIGIGLSEAFLPAFNALYNLELSLNFLGNIELVLVLVAGGILVGLISGSYPAFFLSRFSTSEVLRGKLSQKPGGLSLRRVLVSTQFAVTIAIIISTLVMRKQVTFMKNADLGIKKDNVVAIQTDADDFEDSDQAAIRLETFKNELEKQSGILSVTSSRALPGQRFSYSSFTFATPEGHMDEDPLRMRRTHVDHKFFDLYEIPFVEGRQFRPGSESDLNEGVIINRAAKESFGWDSAVGKTIYLGSDRSAKLTVVGVIENYHFQSLDNEIAPVLHVYRPPEDGIHNFISVKMKNNDLNATLSTIEQQWRKVVASNMPINYFFVDENFKQLYRTQDRLVTVAGVFSIFGILIASLGLLGLVSLMVTHRTREIGIRKVLGATVTRIIYLVSKDYVILVIVGFLLALPATYYLMNNWLQDFAYRINMDVDIFLAGGIIAVLIAVVTVSVQAVKAARLNPAESLRSE